MEPSQLNASPLRVRHWVGYWLEADQSPVECANLSVMICRAARVVLFAVTLAVLPACHDSSPGLNDPAAGAHSAPSVAKLEFAHFQIEASSEPAISSDAGEAAEALFKAYADLFGLRPEASAETKRHHLRLYATREEFKAHSRSRPWAEAYYVDGISHAYVDPSKANPYHWLLHEVVHQLNRELTGFAKEQWLNEGLATYLGSSRYADGRLEPGVPDLEAYPLWWLKRWELSGDFAADMQAQRVIPLRALITGQGGPPLDATVNAHYLGWWSLTHFLLHHDGGRYAAGYHQLVRHGGSLADFERHVGPIERIEPEWYAYLRGMVELHGRTKIPDSPSRP